MSKTNWTKKKRVLRQAINFLNLLLLISTIGAFFIFCVVKFTQSSFGQVSFNQFIFHAKMIDSLTGSITFKQIKDAMIWGCIFLLGTSLVIWLYYLSIRTSTAWDFIKKIFATLNHSFLLITLFFLLTSYFFLHIANKQIDFVGYLSKQNSSYIEHNYYRLNLNGTREVTKKRNLIVIFLEGMEEEYKKKEVFGVNLIPNLTELKKEGVSFDNFKITPGSLYTIDGLAAQIIGLPLINIPFDLNVSREEYALLKKAPSLFNLLDKLGYTTAAFFGSTEQFTKKGNFFRVHGFQNIFSKEKFEESFQITRENGNENWGFNDKFLFQRVQNWLDEPKQPFAILVETVDTHFPDGYVETGKRVFHDARDAFIESDKLTYEFVRWCQQQEWYKDTTIVLVGDHPWQDFDNKFTEFTKKSTYRAPFNLFINSVKGKPGENIFKPGGGYMAMDIAPTILDSMGIPFKSVNDYSKKISTTRLGLGTSLFSEEANLLNRDHIYHVDDQLKQPSVFYEGFF